MLFPTATFAIFFMVVLPLSWLLMPHGERWRPFIIAASFVFYSAWDWRFVLPARGLDRLEPASSRARSTGRPIGGEGSGS